MGKSVEKATAPISDRDPDSDRGSTLHRAFTRLSVSQHRSAGDPNSGHLRGRRCTNAVTIGRDANRAANQWRRQNEQTVRLGDEVYIILSRPPQGWSGEATVNAFRGRFPIDSKNSVVRATRESGFTTFTPSEICVTLKDAAGNEIPVANQCVHINVTSPVFRLVPESDTVKADGGSGRIEVQAPSGQEWAIGTFPV